MKVISIIPITTEKAYTAQTKNTYVFVVPVDASKDLIAKNVEKQFGVKVVGISTLIRKGKQTRVVRKRRYAGMTVRSDKKLAYVVLKEGDKIKVFDEEPVGDNKKADETKSAVGAETTNVAETKKASLFAKRRTGKRGDK